MLGDAAAPPRHGQEAGAAEGENVLLDAEPDPTPVEERVDGYTRKAGSIDQRKVYLWTLAHSNMEGRAKPADFDRRGFACAVLDAYHAAGKFVDQWSVFQETHPLSKSSVEQKLHFHMIVQTAAPSRWLEIAKHLREHAKMFASAATSSSRQSYWTAFGYLYAPTVRKPKEDLDQDYILSPGHPDPPQRLVTKREGIRRLQHLEIFNTIQQHRLDTVLKIQSFAARQHAAGDPAWLTYCMKHPAQKLKQTIASAVAISSADSLLRRATMSHYDVLTSALAHRCICEGRAIPGWEQILTLNGIDVSAYRASLLSAFKEGGGKWLNHMYVGAPSTGKTALTRPVLALFEKYAFVKPQKDTTFALEGLIGTQVVVWNDFRWPLPPLSWGDLLNMLDNEPFRIAVPKVEGAKDYHWNIDGSENVVCFLTSNAPTVHISGGVVNATETAAWNERFGANIYTFEVPLPSADKRYKQWFQCTKCYASWLCPVPLAPGSGGLPPLVETAGRNQEQPCKRARGAASSAETSSRAALPTQHTRAVALPLSQQQASTSAASGTSGTAVALVPSAGSAEPLRDLHVYAQRRGKKPEYNEALVTPEGPWRCTASILGMSARADAKTKKEGKRLAAQKLLQLLM